MRFVDKVLDVVAGELAALHFKPSGRGPLTRVVSPDVLGWVGPNYSTLGGPGLVQVNPAVGVRHQEIERTISAILKEPTIPGRGTVVTGRVERGVLPLGASVEIVGFVDAEAKPRQVVVTGIQMFHKDQKEGRAGENVGLLLRGVDRDEVVRGQVIIAPGSVKSHTKATAELFVIPKEEGGRHSPIFPGYMPQFFFGTTDVTGAVTGLDGGMKMLTPGDHAKVSLELQKPVGMEPGMRFAVREGGKTVGAGVVLRVE